MTAMACGGTSNWNAGPLWLRQRTLGKNKTQRMQMSREFIRELKIEADLVNKNGRPQHLEWSQGGDLLAHRLIDGRSDTTVIVWDVFKQRSKRQPKCQLETGHTGYISSLKFMPAANDTQIVTCGNRGNVRLTNLSTNQNLCVYEKNESNLFGQLAVHPNEPNLICLVENGYVVQCDIRQANQISNQRFSIEIGPKYESYSNCLAINPLRSEMLAVGSGDSRTRLFDRRALRSDASQSCVAQFYPSHFDWGSSYHRSFRTRSLAFNHDGSELLASYDREQVYLFNTYEPWNKFRLFDPSKFKSNPLIFDQARNDLVKRETQINGKSFEFSRRYCGRSGYNGCGASNFFGGEDEFIVSSWVDGTVCIWDKVTTNIVEAIPARFRSAVPHPRICMLATLLCDEDVRRNNVVELWSTIGWSHMCRLGRSEVLAT